MTYRPYPDPDRARHQLDRHVHPRPAMRLAMSPEFQRGYEHWAPFREAFQADMAALTARSVAAGVAITRAFARPAAQPASGGRT